MRQHYPYNWLMRLATKVLKYFLLGLVGCTFAYVISTVLHLSVLTQVLVTLLEQGLARALVLVMCLVAIAVITESLRQ